MSWLNLQGKHVLVIGAGSFGWAVALEFIHEGSKVSLVDQNELLLSDLQQNDSSGLLKTIVCDVTSYDECLTSVSYAQDQFGAIDVFIYAVGINPRKPIEDISLNDWDSVMQVNLRSCFWLAQIVGEGMKKSGGGRMVFFS